MSNYPMFGLEDTSTIYHYTTIDALLGIVRPNNITLWATHYQYLNDKKEIALGLQNIVDKKGFDQDFFENLFILSFSKVPDNLVMWLSYSGNFTGCVLGFRKNLLRTNMVECTYDKAETLKRIEDFNKLINKRSAVRLDEFGSMKVVSKNDLPKFYNEDHLRKGLVYTGIIGSKDKSFEHEREIRSYINVDESEMPLIKYRSRQGLVIPYIEIPYTKDFLKEIWLPGISEKTELTKKSVQRLLAQYGYNGVEIKFSELSYRGQ